jgi:hypothetical protein
LCNGCIGYALVVGIDMAYCVCAIHYQYTINTLSIHTIDIYVILDLYGDYKVAAYTAVCIKLSVYSLLSFLLYL